MQSLQQFGQTIKQKYPEYSDIKDEELGQKMLEKYPQYKDLVSADIPSATFPAKENELMSTSALKTLGNVPRSIATGIRDFFVQPFKDLPGATKDAYGAVKSLAQDPGQLVTFGKVVKQTIQAQPGTFAKELFKNEQKAFLGPVPELVEKGTLGLLGMRQYKDEFNTARQIIENDPKQAVPPLLALEGLVGRVGIKGPMETFNKVTGSAADSVSIKAKALLESKQIEAVNNLEADYSKWTGQTKSGVKKLGQIDTKTAALDAAGTEGVTPQRTLAESRIIPKTSGTKFSTFDQANEYRQSVQPLIEISKDSIKLLDSRVPQIKLADLEQRAINSVNTKQNINSGAATGLEKYVRQQFADLKAKYPTGEIPVSVVDDIKSARWDNVFKNKALVEADKLPKNGDYAIAKAAQKTIEESASAAGLEHVGQLNREIGDRLGAAKFLMELDGQTLKYGKVGKYVFTMVGASLGTTVVGKLFGALGGDLIGEMLMKADVANPVKRIILKSIKDKSPQAYNETIDWIRKQNNPQVSADELMQQLALPPGNPNMFLPEYKGGPSRGVVPQGLQQEALKAQGVRGAGPSFKLPVTNETPQSQSVPIKNNFRIVPNEYRIKPLTSSQIKKADEFYRELKGAPKKKKLGGY